MQHPHFTDDNGGHQSTEVIGLRSLIATAAYVSQDPGQFCAQFSANLQALVQQYDLNKDDRPVFIRLIPQACSIKLEADYPNLRNCPVLQDHSIKFGQHCLKDRPGEYLCTVGKTVKWCKHYRKQYGDSSKN